VVFLEPKGLYRASVGEVPVGDFTVPLGVAEVVKEGKDVTIVGWGAQMRTLEKAVDAVEKEGISCELIDLRTLLPWDVETVEKSVRKTGRLIISHEVIRHSTPLQRHATPRHATPQFIITNKYAYMYRHHKQVVLVLKLRKQFKNDVSYH
jgi:pyruvate/2-oxoglutarate/acetoin dehydrogenase E1 component